MYSTVAARITPRRPAGTVPQLISAQAYARSVRRRVCLAWCLLFLNGLTYYGSSLHVPSIVGKAIAQGALPLAAIAALSVNQRIALRPNLFLGLVTLLPLEALLTTLNPATLGQVYRSFRLVEFVATLWLLTPWWGRRDMLLVRAHLTMLGIILGSVVLGLLVSPGYAFETGRLGGAIWNIPPTEVAHYAAITIGITVVLWLCGHVPGRLTLVVASAAGVILILTHTRTALVAMLAAILVAGLSLFTARARVRRAFAIAGTVTAVAIMTMSSFLVEWLSRGEGANELSDLTGRTLVWGPLLAFPRDRFEIIFGLGLSNSSFNGLPIDSNWLSSYDEQGLFGVAICVLILLTLLVTAYFQPRGVRRALALFLITYCLVASFTEDGFTDATPYMLDMAVAASLLMAPMACNFRLRTTRAAAQGPRPGDLDQPAPDAPTSASP